jgi:cation transport regulator
MTYHSLAELPDSVKDSLPKHAQEIYKEAYNSAWDQYSDPNKRRGNESREAVSRKVAWSAVEKKYEKKDGRWMSKSS